MAQYQANDRFSYIGINRLTGAVSVTDIGATNRSIAGMAFMATNYNTAPAGTFPHVQAWNPPGSGKRMVINDLVIASSFSGNWFISTLSSPLTLPSGTLNPYPKLLGGVVSVMENRLQDNATILGTQLVSGFQVANILVPVPMADPIIVNPGFGLVVGNGSPLTDILLTYYFYEETI